MTKLSPEQIANSEISPSQATYVGTYRELLPPQQGTEALDKYNAGQNLFRIVLRTTALENDIRFRHLDRPIKGDEPDTLLTDLFAFAESPLTEDRAFEISRIIFLRLKAIEAGRNMVGYIDPWYPLETNCSDAK
jgi:hypothetical protein